MTPSKRSALLFLWMVALELAACGTPSDPATDGSGGAAAGNAGSGGASAGAGGAVQSAGSAGTSNGAGAAAGGAGSGAGGNSGSGGDGGTSVGGAAAGSASGGAAGGGAGTPSSGGAGAGGGAGASGAASGGSAGAASGGRAQGGMAGSGGGASGAGSGGAPVTQNPTLFIASDSTASAYGASTTQGGWGQFFGAEFQAGVTVVNRSRGGRTARRFIDAADEQSLDLVWNAIEPGDYLFVQFGTNDSNSSATYVNTAGETIPYYLDPQTDFKTWLRVYIDGARERMATPVLVTPPPRRSCSGDSHSFGNGTARWATAMKELAMETGTAVIDLNQKTLDYLNMIGCIASADFFFNNGTTVDGTHFSKTGAALMAGFVADGIREAGLPLAARLAAN